MPATKDEYRLKLFRGDTRIDFRELSDSEAEGFRALCDALKNYLIDKHEKRRRGVCLISYKTEDGSVFRFTTEPPAYGPPATTAPRSP